MSVSSMENSLIKSLLKFSVLALLVLAIVFSVKIWSIRHSSQNLSRYIESEKQLPKILLVGSSRMRAGVSVQMLERLLPNSHFYNIGNVRSSILYNCRMAEKLMAISASGSIIYVELSDLLIVPPNQADYFYTTNDIIETLKKHFGLRFSFAELDSLALFFFNIRIELGNLFYSEKKVLREIEYRAKEIPFHGGTASIITSEDIEKAPDELTEFQKEYLNMLNQLIEKGRKKNILIRFILPVTIEKATERAQTLSIYKKIRETDKVVYSHAFFSKVHNETCLSDANHLNSNGARLNTFELYKDILKITRR